MRLQTFFEKFELFADAPDAVGKMRELVLEWAVQGRLSDAAESDEPVADFLERIWSDKKDGRSEIADAEKAQPFDLPPHWRWVVLAEVAEFSIGKTPPRADSRYWHPEDHSWVSIADMKHYQTITVTKEKVSSLAAKEVFRQRFAEPGSILMSFKLTIGKVARAGIRCFHNEAIISLYPPEPELTEFLYRFLPVFAALQTSNNAVKGRTLNRGLLTLLPVALPPLAEQKRIVAKVDELMALCDRLEAQQQERELRQAALARATLARVAEAPTPANVDFIFHKSYRISPENLRKLILTLAVQGKLVPQNPNDEEPEVALLELHRARTRQARAGNLRPAKVPVNAFLQDSIPFLPDSWRTVTFDHVAVCHNNALKAGPFGSALKKEFYVERGYKIYGQEQVIAGNPFIGNYYINEEKFAELESCAVSSGDILISLVGTIGRILVLPDGIEPGIINPRVIKLSLDASVVHPAFIKVLMGSPYAVEFFEENSHGGTMNILNLSILRALPLPLPPLPEQRRIVARVEELMALVDVLEAQLGAARNVGAQLTEAVVAELTQMRALA